MMVKKFTATFEKDAIAFKRLKKSINLGPEVRSYQEKVFFLC